MNGFTAYAQAKGGLLGGSLGQVVPLLLMIVVFYFLLIRPQQKKEKDRKRMIDQLQKGDKVMTTSGMFGVVVNVKPEEGVVTLKIAENVKVDFTKAAIQNKVS